MTAAVVIPRESVALPRLQLRWAPGDEPEVWLCYYELVLPLRNADIRRDIYDEDSMQIDKRDELAIPMSSGPTRRTGNGPGPCKSEWAEGFWYDDPYRAGKHAEWDSDALRGIPFYVVAPDGTYLVKAQPKDDAKHGEGKS